VSYGKRKPHNARFSALNVVILNWQLCKSVYWRFRSTVIGKNGTGTLRRWNLRYLCLWMKLPGAESFLRS